jgi:predicted outer membrane repeat protein
VVVVLPGTYHESINFKGKAITVQSTDLSDPTVVSATILLGAEHGRPIVNFGEGSTATLAGFTIQGGGASIPCPPCAGGINIRAASPMIYGNHIIDHPNGAISIIESNAQIVDNLIANNAKGSPGAAIYVNCYYVAPTITGNTFENNTAPSGGAIYITSPSADPTPATAARTVVSNNTFRNNTSTKFGGGAIFVEYTGNLKLDTPV